MSTVTVERPTSVRRTLWLYLGALLALFTIGLVIAARGYGERAANRSYDHLLVSSALSIADSVALVDGQWQLDLPYAALDLLAMAPEDRVFYRVWDARGQDITGYDDLPAPDELPQQEPRLFDAVYSGERVRFVVVARSVVSASGQGEVLVQVGQTRLARQAVAGDLVTRALGAILLLSLLAMGLVALGVHRALRPLARVERELSRREPSDLRPLQAGAPQEMDQMVGALNHFMARLASSNETLRAFMGDAAHQMRTPLAALRAQAQLALEDDDDPAQMRRSLLAIERNAVSMSRLLNQLLSDASVIHRSNMRQFAPLDVVQVARQALDELAHGDHGGRLVPRLPDTALPILGDALLLREAIKNLLDNALKYGGDAPVELSVGAVAGGCVLQVCDRGPGIPLEDMDQVFERFKRGQDVAADGAGLGLAIVRRIIDSHGGRIDLRNRDGGGLCVDIHLPGREA